MRFQKVLPQMYGKFMQIQYDEYASGYASYVDKPLCGFRTKGHFFGAFILLELHVIVFRFATLWLLDAIGILRLSSPDVSGIDILGPQTFPLLGWT